MVDENGMCTRQWVYRGSRAADPGDVSVGLATKVVAECMDSLATTGHLVFTDNFYGHFETLQAIAASSNYCCLMMRNYNAKRDVAKDKSMVLTLKQLLAHQQRGTCLPLYHNSGEYMLQGWKDNAPVVLLTNYFRFSFLHSAA